MSPSDPDLEARALRLLDEALDQPSQERSAWVEARTRDDEALRARLLSLLRASSHVERLRTGGASAAGDEPPPPPQRIGAYRLTEPLGQGGMGAVYRAERDAGDFTHTAAIKIIRPGALSEALVERFTRERQILADLSHPNIARLFDGGQTADGQPFIIMEHVDGRPIIDWANDRGLDLRARLALFLRACDGVRFAHQNLIVHRDLTPSNVLVTELGEVKLIDFGIARPPEADAAPRGRQERATADLSLTPGFSAPERSLGAASSTLMDVYSLGELLKALTAGRPPDSDLTAVAARASSARPERRYASVDALMDDLQRWLDGRPVAARGGGRRYAFGKFARRHWRAVSASAAVAVLLVAALAVTLAAYADAERANAAEQRRFAELRSLAGYMIFQLNDRLAPVAGNTRARVDVAARAQRYLSALAGGARGDADLQRESARGFVALAQVQGVPGQPNLGQREQARANLTTAVVLLNAGGLQPAEASDFAEAQVGLAMIAGNTDADPAAAGRRLAVAERALTGVPAVDRDARWLSARSRLRRAQLDMAVLGHDVEALPQLATQLEAEAAQLPPAAARRAEQDRAYADHNRCIHGYFTDDLAASVAAAERAQARLLALDRARPNEPQVLYDLAWSAYVGFGAADGLTGGRPQAERMLVLAQSSIDRLLRVEENDTSLRNFAGQIGQARSQALSSAGRHREAEEAQVGVIAALEAAAGAERRPATLNRLASAQIAMTLIAAHAGDRDRACDSSARYRRLIAELDARGAALGEVRSHMPVVERNLARCAGGAPVSTFEAAN